MRKKFYYKAFLGVFIIINIWIFACDKPKNAKLNTEPSITKFEKELQGTYFFIRIPNGDYNCMTPMLVVKENYFFGFDLCMLNNSIYCYLIELRKQGNNYSVTCDATKKGSDSGLSADEARDGDPASANSVNELNFTYKGGKLTLNSGGSVRGDFTRNP